MLEENTSPRLKGREKRDRVGGEMVREEELMCDERTSCRCEQMTSHDMSPLIFSTPDRIIDILWKKHMLLLKGSNGPSANMFFLSFSRITFLSTEMCSSQNLEQQSKSCQYS